MKLTVIPTILKKKIEKKKGENGDLGHDEERQFTALLKLEYQEKL